MQWLIYTLAGCIALMLLMLLMQLFMLLRARRSIGSAVPDTSALDDAAPEAGRRLYDFHAAHCGPYRAMTARVETKLKGTLYGLLRWSDRDALRQGLAGQRRRWWTGLRERLAV